ncbi:MAG: hypothetical protein DRP83_03810 [Planctomycetota bacterium]|nr:MAG: hypothetical protein DRP83_03810 [Planctomycetota bacterium]
MTDTTTGHRLRPAGSRNVYAGTSTKQKAPPPAATTNSKQIRNPNIEIRNKDKTQPLTAIQQFTMKHMKFFFCFFFFVIPQHLFAKL